MVNLSPQPLCNIDSLIRVGNKLFSGKLAV